MQALRQALRDYLALRRSLGYKLRHTESYLRLFLVFLRRRHRVRLTAALALEFATADPSLSAHTRAARFTAVRGFAQYRHGDDPRSEVPPAGLVPTVHSRAELWSCADAPLADLLQSFQDRPVASPRGLRPWTLPR